MPRRTAANQILYRFGHDSAAGRVATGVLRAGVLGADVLGADARGADVVGGGNRGPRSLGTAVAPRTETIVLARGTHRTRVSEMRLSAARAASPRPNTPGAVLMDQHAATERNEGALVRDGTG